MLSCFRDVHSNRGRSCRDCINKARFARTSPITRTLIGERCAMYRLLGI
jgi:hypothetical protein